MDVDSQLHVAAACSRGMTQEKLFLCLFKRKSLLSYVLDERE
jgi:hypothetical protein